MAFLPKIVTFDRICDKNFAGVASNSNRMNFNSSGATIAKGSSALSPEEGNCDAKTSFEESKI
jgi:hypothetical protein